MVFKVRRKPSWMKKRRVIRRRKVIPRRGVKQPVQYFKRSKYAKAAYTTSTTSDVFAAYYGTLADVPNSIDFTTLYDQYKILGIKYTLIPRVTESDTTQQIGNVWSILDYDDSTVPSGLDTMLQYQNLKMTRGHKMHGRYFKPRVNMELNQNTSTPAMAPITSWIDVTSETVPHRGIKICLQQTPTVITYDLKVDYYMSFKNVR